MSDPVQQLQAQRQLDPSDAATEGIMRDQIVRISRDNGMVIQLIEEGTREYVVLYKLADQVTWRDQLDHTMRALGTVWLDPLKQQKRPPDESNLIDHGFYALYLARKQWLAREAGLIRRGFQVMARGILIEAGQSRAAGKTSTKDDGG